MTDLRVGDLIELEIGPFAHGGHCVARHDGRVVFVRHTLPGERVRARIRQVRSRLARADAIEVLAASPDRVEPPCRFSGPGGCGGCDFQHVALPAQRAAKAAVIVEALTRLGGLTPDHRLGDSRLADLRVLELAGPGGAPDGLGWRTRVQFAVDETGAAGLRRHASREIVPVEQCLLAHPGVAALQLTRQRWPGLQRVEGIASSAGDRLVVLTPGESATPRRLPRELRHRLPADVAVRMEGVPGGIGRGWVAEDLPGGGRARVTGSGFWQVHPGAADALVTAVLEQLDPKPGEHALDLYGGVGLFSLALIQRLGPEDAPAGAAGTVRLVEGDRRAVSDARRNVHRHPRVRCLHGRVDAVLADRDALGPDPVNLVVLDPPRAGAGRTVVRQVAALAPRAISYVACDPAALARDTAIFTGLGWRLDRLAAYDLFPHTHHVECVARFVPDGLESRPAAASL